MDAHSRPTKERRTRRPVGNFGILPGVVAGVIRNSVSEPHDLRSELLRNAWIELKRFGARNVRSIELTRLRGIQQVEVNGPVARHGLLVFSALAALLECDTIFAFGAFDDHAGRLLAKNLPNAQIYSFDRSDGGFAERGSSPSAAPTGRPITRLSGDSATFDFSPYSGTVDLVHIDGSRRLDSLASDTEAAFSLLSELGSIVWYGYTYQPAVYAFLNDIAPSLDRPIHHLRGTRLAFYCRWDVVLP
jgi:hypothetical protein